MPAFRNRSRKYVKKTRRLALRGNAYPMVPAVGRNRGSTFARRGFNNNPGELKYMDLAQTSYAYDTTGSVTCLNLIAQGDDNTNRQGRQIMLKSVHVQGLIAPLDGSTSPSICRTLLIWDAQPNSGSLPTITDILKTSHAITSTNLDNRQRFTILRDQKTALGGIFTTVQQTYAQSPTVASIEWFVPLGNMRTTYSGTSAAIGAVSTGSLLLVTIGSAGALDGGQGVITTRLRFYDF